MLIIIDNIYFSLSSTLSVDLISSPTPRFNGMERALKMNTITPVQGLRNPPPGCCWRVGFATWGLCLFWRAEGRGLFSLDQHPSCPASTDTDTDTGTEAGGLESKYADEAISS